MLKRLRVIGNALHFEKERSQRCKLSSRPPSEEAQIKYTFSPNKIGHAVSAPIKRRLKKITVNCRAAVYNAANDN